MSSSSLFEKNERLGTGPVPVEPIISPGYFEAEKEKIFRRVWLNVGRGITIPNSGDFFVKDIPLLGYSIIVLRGDDGKVRTFHNVCKHRGNKLIYDVQGNVHSIVCNFHGWTYEKNGCLAFVPDKEEFFQDPIEHVRGLSEVTTDCWYDFIFVCFGEPMQSLDDWMSDFGHVFDGYPLDIVEVSAIYSVEVHCNWKLLVDAFVEAYHAPFLHAKSLGRAFSNKSNPYSHVTYAELYKNHRRVGLWGNPQYRPTKAEAMALSYGERSWPLPTSEEAQRSLPAGLNPNKHPEWFADVNIVFPNYIVNVLDNLMVSYNFWPISYNRTICDVTWYQPRPRTVGQKVKQEFSTVLGRDTFREDLNTLEGSQLAMQSGVIKEMLFSSQEIACRHNYKVVADFLNS